MLGSPSGPGGQGFSGVLNIDRGSFSAGQKYICGVFIIFATYRRPNSTY
jgi:hypothetical protein